MKIPLTPPEYNAIFDQIPRDQLAMVFKLISEKKISSVTSKGEYIHWDKLRHLQPISGLSTEEYWIAIKHIRRTLYKSLPFYDKYQRAMQLALPDIVLHKLHLIDRKAGSSGTIINPELRDSYLTHSLIEESITSSQLEGASTTRKIAKEMLQTSRKPRTKSEQMIYNNYQAMQFIREMKEEKLTPNMILELHLILTKDTLDDPASAGKFRTENDNIHVWDHTDGVVLHTPPNANELNARIKKLCDFANATENPKEGFIHPVVRAILLHYMLAYDHPFVDGNGRTARALFYWSMAHQHYSLMEYISISKVIKQSPRQYAKAYLYTETDENDLTYFIIHQLDVITKAIDELELYLKEQAKGIDETERLFVSNSTFRNNLNYRQVLLLNNALKNPNDQYRIEIHRQSQNITYETARTDLLDLVKLGLLVKKTVGKAFVFIPADNLAKKLRGKS